MMRHTLLLSTSSSTQPLDFDMSVLKNIDRIGASLLLALGLNPLGCSNAIEDDPGCLTSTPELIQGQPTGFSVCDEEGTRGTHIPGATTCSPLPRILPTSCGSNGQNAECQTDNDCPGANNVCGEDPATPGLCRCIDSCTTTADCDADEVCLCSPIPYGLGWCAPSNCKSDADCKGDNLCMRIKSTMNWCGRGERGLFFACTTDRDECTTDDDCTTPGFNVCALSAEGHRFCAENCGAAIGRPFLIEGHARVAPLEARADWCAGELAPNLDALDNTQRAALCTYWSELGQMEHASVAAFARFAMQLMSVGAPPELLEQTTAAMADETRHAKMAFALASAFGDRPIGPGPLTIDDALGQESLADMLALVIHEGCIGETIAAAEAAEALDHTNDPAIRNVLITIIDDETRHAALAWNTVRWALSLGQDTLRERIEEEFQTTFTTKAQNPTTITADAQRALDLGIVTDDVRSVLRHHMLARVIEPCLHQLLEESAPHANRV